MRKSFKYRIYPSKKQKSLLKQTLRECRWLYNQLLEQRKTAWEKDKKSLSLYTQHATYSELKKDHPSLKEVHSQVLQNVGVRLDLAFKAFFRRVKAKENPGYPRFKGRYQYDSFTYPQSGFKISEDGLKVRLSKIGSVKLILHRNIEGKIRTCNVRRTRTGKWFITFSCELEKPEKLPESDKEIGIDLGIKTFGSFSDGNLIENPRFFKKNSLALAKAQRKFSKLEKENPLRAKARKVVSRIHERTKWCRDDFIHQESRKIIDKYGLICIEDLDVNRMVHDKCFSKSISDVAWGYFSNALSIKAECAGRKFVKVNPAYTSQTCSKCGHRQPMPLSVRNYDCRCCKLSLDRDINAAKNILALGKQCLLLGKETPLRSRSLTPCG